MRIANLRRLTHLLLAAGSVKSWEPSASPVGSAPGPAGGVTGGVTGGVAGAVRGRSGRAWRAGVGGRRRRRGRRGRRDPRGAPAEPGRQPRALERVVGAAARAQRGDEQVGATAAGGERAHVRGGHLLQRARVDGDRRGHRRHVDHEQLEPVGELAAAVARRVRLVLGRERERRVDRAGVGDRHRAAGLLAGPHRLGAEDRGVLLGVRQRQRAARACELQLRRALAGRREGEAERHQREDGVERERERAARELGEPARHQKSTSFAPVSVTVVGEHGRCRSSGSWPASWSARSSSTCPWPWWPGRRRSACRS